MKNGNTTWAQYEPEFGEDTTDYPALVDEIYTAIEERGLCSEAAWKAVCDFHQELEEYQKYILHAEFENAELGRTEQDEEDAMAA
jgi:hypothetical protein